MPAEFNRAQRLGEQIKRDLALLIQRELKDPRIGMVTVNFVHLSKDLILCRCECHGVSALTTLMRRLLRV